MERFTGFIDELAIYNRALSQAEIQSIFAADASGKCVPGSGDPPCPTGQSNITGWWPGEDDASDIVGSNDGVPLNGTSFVNGLVGRAFSFDGVDDYVNVPHADSISFSNSEAFAVEAWFRPASNTPSYFVLKNAGPTGTVLRSSWTAMIRTQLCTRERGKSAME